MKMHQPSGVETWESRRSGSLPKVLSVFSLFIYVFSFSLVTGNEIIFKISSPKLYFMPGIVDMMLKVVADGDEANLEQKSMSCEKYLRGRFMTLESLLYFLHWPCRIGAVVTSVYTDSSFLQLRLQSGQKIDESLISQMTNLCLHPFLSMTSYSQGFSLDSCPARKLLY